MWIVETFVFKRGDSDRSESFAGHGIIFGVHRVVSSPLMIPVQFFEFAKSSNPQQIPV